MLSKVRYLGSECGWGHRKGFSYFVARIGVITDVVIHQDRNTNRADRPCQ